MDGNFNQVENAIKVLKQAKVGLEEIRENIVELQNIPEVDPEHLESLFGEEFKALVEYSSLTRRLEQAVDGMDNVFIRNRFKKELEDLKINRSVSV